METMRLIDMTTPEGRAEVEAYEREKKEMVAQGQQIYARIKRSSKYYHQNEFAKQSPGQFGWPFRVFIDPACGSYCVQGGPGGQYRLADVNLFVIVDGREQRIA